VVHILHRLWSSLAAQAPRGGRSGVPALAGESFAAAGGET
jgi:hypothetical protein